MTHVETVNWENHGNRDIPLYKRIYKGEHITTLFTQSASPTHGSWHLLSHNYAATYSCSLFLTLFLLYSIQYVINIFPRCIYTHTPFRAIYKCSPQGYINHICKHSPELVSTNPTIVRVDVDLII